MDEFQLEIHIIEDGYFFFIGVGFYFVVEVEVGRDDALQLF